MEEVDYLRSLMVRPDDRAVRKSYADWLGEQGDPRARVLYFDPPPDEMGFVQFLLRLTYGDISFYIERYPDLQPLLDAWNNSEGLRRQKEKFCQVASVDSKWLAFVESLGRPFEPFYFFSNHGRPAEFPAADLPFNQQIGSRGFVVTFPNDFRDDSAFDVGLLDDLGQLRELEVENCFYGAASCPIHTFVCELPSTDHELTGTDILSALHAKGFRNPFISDLASTYIPFPGDHRDSELGEYNDQIHNDFLHQHIFATANENTNDPIDEFTGAHGALKRSVVNGKLWYVLLHTALIPYEGTLLGNMVILFAVGKSKHGKRLIGVVTHQVCHNLCD